MISTPIVDFVRKYAKENKARFHMPGHKGVPFLGLESLDITAFVWHKMIFPKT